MVQSIIISNTKCHLYFPTESSKLMIDFLLFAFVFFGFVLSKALDFDVMYLNVCLFHL